VSPCTQVTNFSKTNQFLGPPWPEFVVHVIVFKDIMMPAALVDFIMPVISRIALLSLCAICYSFH